MSNNFVLIILLIFFVLGILYVLLKLKDNSPSQHQQGENLQISPDEVYQQVEALAANADYNTAQKLAKKYLNQNPYHHDLRKLLVKIYISIQKEYEAISNLLVLIKTFPDDMSLYTQIADLYRDTHQTKKAVYYYSYLLSKDKYDLHAMKSLALLYYNNKQKDSALKLYRQLVTLVENEDEKLEYYELLGSLYSSMNQYDKAISAYKKVLEKDSANIEVIKDMRRIYLKLKDTDSVLYYSRLLVNLEPENYKSYEEIIDLLFHLHMYDDALTYAQKAMNLPNADVYTLKNYIAKIYIYTGKTDESIELISETIKQDPTNLLLSQTLAMAYCMNKNFEMAKKVCHDAIEVAIPSDIKIIHNNLSSILTEEAVYLLNKGRTKQAFDKFGEAMQYNNENPEIYYKLALANNSIKNYSEAIKQCKRAIELAPEISLYYETLGDIYMGIQNFIEAKRYYKEAVFIDPKNARAHALFGTLQSKDGDHDNAIRSLETAVALEPNNIDIRYNLALAYEVAGRKEDAKIQYQKVLDANPNHKEAMNNIKLL